MLQNINLIQLLPHVRDFRTVKGTSDAKEENKATYE
jgi:hypothetical protein